MDLDAIAEEVRELTENGAITDETARPPTSSSETRSHQHHRRASRTPAS